MAEVKNVYQFTRMTRNAEDVVNCMLFDNGQGMSIVIDPSKYLELQNMKPGGLVVSKRGPFEAFFSWNDETDLMLNYTWPDGLFVGNLDPILFKAALDKQLINHNQLVKELFNQLRSPASLQSE